MEPFARLEAVAVPIPRANVDTDQILPARYLQKPRANDFGQFLFRDLRFRADGSDEPGFVLNQAAFRFARIVVAERNFGCGSSREHAVWALYDYGIRAVIAPSFGDIFFSNALKNGLLPIVLGGAVVARMIDVLQARPGSRIGVDLEGQTVIDPDGVSHRFDIAPFPKHCLLNGLDELAYTLSQSTHIDAFEQRYQSEDPYR
jgi:3-isopropylmalate/(R)-2-methylmalate dehydratase small subunit